MPHGRRPAIHGRDHWPDGPDPASEHWSFVEPVAPAIEDDALGYATSDFEGAWLNIGDPYAPTSFRLVEGKLQLRIAATGDESTPGSTIFTLPSTHWPTRTIRMFVPLGDNAIGIVDANADGTIVFVGQAI